MKTIYLGSREDVVFGLKVIVLGGILLSIITLVDWLRKMARN